METLFAETWQGPAGESPLVLLHGFGARAAVWRGLAQKLCLIRPVIAYDLPGHGGSLAIEPGGAGRMAKAVLADLGNRGVRSVHLCGHSLGGATAALAALRMPMRLESLTLLAPGGFGPDIAAASLARWRDATGEAELRDALEPMAAPGFRFSAETLHLLAQARRLAESPGALAAVYASMIDGNGRQGVLPVADLAGLGCPVRLLWGLDDAILPVSQADGLPPHMEVTRISDAGHMLIEEAPERIEAVLSALP